MSIDNEKLLRAERLSAICTHIGFTLWQLQELESTSAIFFTLLVEAQPGMGLAKGKALEEIAKKRTFGQTVSKLKESGIIVSYEEDFQNILENRNWLIHRSKSDWRAAVYNDDVALELINRIEKIAEDAMALMKVINQEVSRFLEEKNIPQSDVQKSADQILKEWHSA